MQAQVLAAYKVGVAHSLAAFAGALMFMASTDTSASASASSRISASVCSCHVSCVGVAIVTAAATVAIAAAGVGCIVFLKELTTADQTICSTTEWVRNARPVGEVTVWKCRGKRQPSQ